MWTQRHDHADQLHRQRQLRPAGGGLQVTNGGTMTLGNTIWRGNTALADVRQGRGAIASSGPQPDRQDRRQHQHHLGSSDLTGTIAKPLLPLVAALGNYGGPTQTMALLPGSPAIDRAATPSSRAASPPTSAAFAHRQRHRRHRRGGEPGLHADRDWRQFADHECHHGVLQSTGGLGHANQRE